MSDTAHYDGLESRAPAERERDFFTRFVPYLEQALDAAPGLKAHLGDVDAASITSREVALMMNIAYSGVSCST